jgi:hypothetical protein
MPAASICQEAATKLFALSLAWRETMLPTVQESAIAGQPNAQRWPDQGRQAGKAEQQAQPAAPGQGFSAGQRHFNQRHIERGDREDQGCQPAGHGFLGVNEAHIAAPEQQQSHQAEEGHVARRPRETQATPAAPGQKDGSGDGESHS